MPPICVVTDKCARERLINSVLGRVTTRLRQNGIEVDIRVEILLVTTVSFPSPYSRNFCIVHGGERIVLRL